MNLKSVTPGDVIEGKYRVERLLGEGAMGFVVAARHLTLDEPVALKFLLPRLAADPQLVERFLREARASVKLKNVHVARVLDVGMLARGKPYIVMEYLEGHDLAHRLAEADIAVAEACDLVLQTCAALVEAHALGIVHRDLKPANLFVTEGHDGGPHIKILDFGISKQVFAAADDERVTGADHALGSPAYMAPEQMRGAAGVDQRADLYSLGVVLYEMLAGRLPFTGPSMAEMCNQVLAADVPPLPAEIPAGLASAVHHCLARNPAERPASVVALAGLLAPFASERGRQSAAGVAAFARARQRPRVALPLRAPEDTRELIAGSLAARRVRRSSAPPVGETLISSQDVTESMAPVVPIGSPPDVVPVTRRRRLIFVASLVVMIASLLGIAILMAIR